MDDIFRPILPPAQNVKPITRDQNAQDQKQPSQQKPPPEDATAQSPESESPPAEDSVLLSLSYIRTQIGMWSPHDQLPPPEALSHISPETRQALTAYHKIQGYAKTPPPHGDNIIPASGQNLPPASVKTPSLDDMIDQLEYQGLTAIPVYHGEALDQAVMRAFKLFNNE